MKRRHLHLIYNPIQLVNDLHKTYFLCFQTLPLSKGGWRPVVGSGGFVFGYGTAPLHAPSYRIPVPVLDSYPSSARPLMARDATKLTSIAQSYRPTTIRAIPAGGASIPAASQPINSYLNPFSLPSNGLTHYKYVQNFPADSVIIRNPHNPYAARPVYTKYPTKFKQSYPMQQQLTNIQPIQFAQPASRPLDNYGKPADAYGRPEKKPVASADIETYKPEVYKLPDNNPASQSVTQQVKTAQQSLVTPKVPPNAYPQYSYQDHMLPPSILGSFGSFGLHSMKGRDPLYPARTTYYPPQTTKQTIFNSFSFAPNFKTTPAVFISTTPKLQTTANQIHYGTNWNVPTQAPKPVAPEKIDPNMFKASPQDPFITKYNGNYKVSTYNPTVQTTTFAYNNFHEYKYPLQHNSQQHVQESYYNMQQQHQQEPPVKKKQKIHDSLAQLTNQQTSQQYANPPQVAVIDGAPNTVPFRATYEVTETYDDGITHISSPVTWSSTPENQKATEEAVTKQEYDTAYSKPPTPLPDLPEEYAIVTEGDKGYENSLSYDGEVESQSRRPLGDDFEPIGKHKLKEYYYRVTTPAYDDRPTRRTKKPTQSSKISAPEVTTYFSKDNDLSVEPLPTLAPNKHFKRPSSTFEPPTERDRVRKRNKLRRRRPPLANINRDYDSSTSKYISSTEPSDETHTIRPRVRPTQAKPQLTTPTTSTDLSTSAVPTVSPTSPTIVKKKLLHRRPYKTSTTEKSETTTTYKEHDSNKESPIMKISASSRPHLPKISSTAFEYQSSAVPDYSHKQDEKDTPTSDIAVSLSDSLRTDVSGPSKNFSFHRDTKPIEAKLEPVRELTTDISKDSIEIYDIPTTMRTETTSNSGKILRPRLKNKYNRPNFSVKDYRNRLSSTTSTTEKPAESNAPKIRFPQRRIPISENETSTERKKFTPKDPRQKSNGSELNDQTEKEIHSIRPNRNRQTVEPTEGTTQKISSRIRNGSRRPKPTETDQTTETSSPTIDRKRILRKKIKDSEHSESVQDVSVTETISGSDITSERTRSESAIMKIADKKHHDHIENIFEHSKRVSDLTLAASKDYNTPGMFKTVSASSRRIPNYFTIATDDPILPIEAFFPQINQKKES